MVNIRKTKEKGRKLPNVLNKKQLLKLFGCMEETDVFIVSFVTLCIRHWSGRSDTREEVIGVL